MVMVLAAFSSAKVVLNSKNPRTFTWSPAKSTKHSSYGLNWSEDNCKLTKVSQNIMLAKLPWSIKTLYTFHPKVAIDISIGSFS